MNFKKIFLMSVIFFSNISYASHINLQQERILVIKKYINYLGDSHFKNIPSLFLNTATVIPKSGSPDSPKHFYADMLAKTHFETKTTLLDIFNGQMDNNVYIVYFHFEWKTPDRKFHSENYLDYILFENGLPAIQKLVVLGAYKL